MWSALNAGYFFRGTLPKCLSMNCWKNHLHHSQCVRRLFQQTFIRLSIVAIESASISRSSVPANSGLCWQRLVHFWALGRRNSQIEIFCFDLAASTGTPAREWFAAGRWTQPTVYIPTHVLFLMRWVDVGQFGVHQRHKKNRDANEFLLFDERWIKLLARWETICWCEI